MEYQELIKVIRDELESSELIARVEKSDIPDVDTRKRSFYPLAAFYCGGGGLATNVVRYTVQLLVVDILDINKETDQDNEDFILNQSFAVVNNLYNKLNRGVLFTELVQSEKETDFDFFTDKTDKGLAGVEVTFEITVKNEMTLCTFPFKYAANGVTVVLKSGYAAGTTGKVQGDNSGKIYTALDNDQLKALKNTSNPDYTSVCTTLVTNMDGPGFGSRFFPNAFNQPINSWDVTNVISSRQLFQGSRTFNQPLNYWNFKNNEDMYAMFIDAETFNQDLSGWCVPKIATEPGNFDINTTAWVLPNSRPIWGTCP